MTINTESQQELVRLTASPSSGIIDPLTHVFSVTFEAEAYLPNPVASYTWDFNGDGVPEITGPEATVTGQYQYPGLYLPKVTVTDNQGNSYTETTLVNVLFREEMDALLRSKWEEVRSKLLSGDIEGALLFFDEYSKEDYRELFNALASFLQDIVGEMSDIQIIKYRKNAAIYDIQTIRDGIEYSFQLLFTQDNNGIWRINSF